MSGINAYTRSSPPMRMIKEQFPDYLTTAELAALVERGPQTVARWRLKGFLEPSHVVEIGKGKVWLYDEEKVQEALKLARTLKPGRKSTDGKRSLTQQVTDRLRAEMVGQAVTTRTARTKEKSGRTKNRVKKIA